MTRERQIPESRIALDPVVIDDSKRESKEYREQGYTPRKSDELWEKSPMNPEKKKDNDKKKMENYMETLEDYVK